MSGGVKLALSGVGLTGVVSATYFGFFHNPMPEWRPLSEDADAASYGDGKYAKNHTHFLVGVGEAASGKTPADNSAWWNWSFNTNYRKNADKKTDSFTESVADGASLKEQCKQAYLGSLAASPTDRENKKVEKDGKNFNELEVWKYCSGLGIKPKTISESKATIENAFRGTNAANTSLGKELKDTAISIADPDNELFWQIQHKRFAGSVSADDKYFSAQIKTMPIKQVCNSAYSLNKSNPDTSSASTPSSAEVKKYCTLSGA